MKKRLLAGIAVFLAALVLLTLFGYRAQKATVLECTADAVIAALDDGKTVVQVENYRTYLPAGEALTPRDRIAIRCSFFNDLDIRSIRLLTD